MGSKLFWTYLTMVFLATWKFMFTPLAGYYAKLSFLETIITVLIGAYIAASISYFGSSYFIRRSAQKRVDRMQKAIKNGGVIRPRKIFTKKKRKIIQIKQRVSPYFIYWAFPLFLSIPGGCIIVAKFYKHHPQTFPMILLFLTLDCLLISSGVYFLRFS